jgi:membrane fusion protein (multidrug efflux system)
MFGRIGIVYDKHENALQVPRSAILEDSGATSVFVVADDKATRRPVDTGYSNKGMVEVTDGLDDNDQVVTVGQVGLKDDATVTIINAVESNPELAESADTQVSEDATPD